MSQEESEERYQKALTDWEQAYGMHKRNAKFHRFLNIVQTIGVYIILTMLATGIYR